MENRVLDSKINEYINERLVFLIGFSNLPDDVIDDITTASKDHLNELLNTINEFEKKNVNNLPDSVCNNYVKFVNHKNIRFNGLFINKENNAIINDIIGYANSNKFINFNFFAEEARKFYSFEIGRKAIEIPIDKLLELEEYVYEFLLDSLFSSDEEFTDKYLFNSCFSQDDMLHIINYLTSDFPLILRDSQFMKRISIILEVNKEMTESKEIAQEGLKNMPIIDKILSLSELKRFKKKNNAVIQNVINGYNRS